LAAAQSGENRQIARRGIIRAEQPAHGYLQLDSQQSVNDLDLAAGSRAWQAILPAATRQNAVPINRVDRSITEHLPDFISNLFRSERPRGCRNSIDCLLDCVTQCRKAFRTLFVAALYLLSCDNLVADALQRLEHTPGQYPKVKSR